MHLHSHARVLVDAIKKKAILQYCRPYSRLNIVAMAIAFGLSFNDLESEVDALIADGSLNARIDAISKVNEHGCCELF